MSESPVNVDLSFAFEPRDLWVGLYWDVREGEWWRELTFYVCLVPLLPLRVRFTVPKEASHVVAGQES